MRLFSLYALRLPKSSRLMWLLGCVCLVVSCGASLRQEAERAVKRVPVVRLSATKQQRFNEVYLHAVTARLRENYAEAYLLMEEALRIHPHAPEALYEMSLLMRESAVSWEDSALIARADSLLERATFLLPTNRTLLLALSDRYTEKEQFRDAIYYREQAQKLHPDDEANLYDLTNLYRLAKDNAGAVRTLDRLERLFGATEQISLRKFDLYAEMGDSARAFQALEDLCAQYPQDLRYRVILGDAYARVGRGEMAEYIYQDVLTTEPNNGFAQLSLMERYRLEENEAAYLAMLRRLVLNTSAADETRLAALQQYVAEHLTGDSTEVVRLFEEVLALPQSNRSFPALYLLYLTHRNAPSRVKKPVAEQLLKMEPDHKATRFQLLTFAIEEGDMEAVHRHCAEGLRYHPAEPAYYYYQALAYVEQKRKKDALVVAERGVQLVKYGADAMQLAELYYLQADLLHEMGRKEEAYAAYDSVLLYDSSHLLARNNYAYYLAKDGRRLDYAEKLSRRTIEAEPQNATYLDTYAWILFRQQDYQRARTYIDSTLACSDRPTATLYEHAGDIYYRCGNIKEAVGFWRAALGLHPDKDSRRRLQRKVQRRKI